MTGDRSDVADVIEQFHEDVPHRFQVSLTMSMDVRDDVRAIRDELNDVLDSRDVTTNDVIRLALIATARYHPVVAGDSASLEDTDREQLVPLTAVVSRVIDDEETLDPSDQKR